MYDQYRFYSCFLGSMLLILVALVRNVYADDYHIHFQGNLVPILEHVETKMRVPIPSFCTLFGQHIDTSTAFGGGSGGQWVYLNDTLYFMFDGDPNWEPKLCNQKTFTFSSRLFRFSLTNWSWSIVNDVPFQKDDNMKGMFATESSLIVILQRNEHFIYKLENTKWTFLERMPKSQYDFFWHWKNELCITQTTHNGYPPIKTYLVMNLHNLETKTISTACENKAHFYVWNKQSNVNMQQLQDKLQTLQMQHDEYDVVMQELQVQLRELQNDLQRVLQKLQSNMQQKLQKQEDQWRKELLTELKLMESKQHFSIFPALLIGCIWVVCCALPFAFPFIRKP
jgi:hypothetical protein